MTFAARLTEMIFRLRWPLFAFICVLVLLLAAGIPRLEVSSDSRNFFGQDNQEYANLLQLEDTYTLSNNLLLMVLPPEGEAFRPESLQVLRQMTEDAWQMPYALRVDSALNHMHSFAQDDEVYVEPMLDEFVEITAEVAADYKALAMASEELRNTLLAESGDAFGIVIRVVLPDGNPDARSEVEAFLRDLRIRWETENPGWDVRAIGSVLGNSLLAKVAIEDIKTLVPLAILSAVVIFALAIGSVLAIAVMQVVFLGATAATFGFAGWAGIELTAGTVIGPMAVLVLVSTSCIHVLIGGIRAAERGEAGDPLRYSIEHNIAPITISHLTTGFGFLCLNFASSPPLADMGNMVAFGLLIAHLCVFCILPALLYGRAPVKAGLLMASGQTMRMVAGAVLRRGRWWIVLFSLGGIAAITGLLKLGYDDNIFRYFDHRYELRQDAEAIQERLTGLDTLQFSFAAPEGQSVFEPEFLRAIDRFETWLDEQPAVVSVSSLPHIIKDLNKSMSGDDPDQFAVADTQPANAQLLMFYELSLPVGMDLNVMMDVDRTQTLLTATVRALHTDVLRTLAERAETWLAENEPLLVSEATGLSIAFARISQRNNAQMLYGFLTALCLISLTLMITLRSVKFGLISIVPNLAPALLAFGLWGWTMRDVNLGSTVVTTMTFGIVVDDTVHFLMHYLRGRRRNLGTQEALTDTFAVVGSSIALTSVAMMVGFAIMVFSGFSINQHIGLLTAIVVLFALLCDLLLLPAILNSKLDRQK